MPWMQTTKKKHEVEEVAHSSSSTPQRQRAVGLFELEPNDDDDGQTPSTPNIGDGDIVLLNDNDDVDDADEEDASNNNNNNNESIFSRLLNGRFHNNRDIDDDDDDEFYEEIATYTTNRANAAATNDDGNDDDAKNTEADDKILLLSFTLLVIIGTGNKIFQKLQAIPMYNYPNSLNLITTFMYIPLCFAYILPVTKYEYFNNAIPTEVASMSKIPFVIMGILDGCAGLLFTFASVYLPGSLLLLLPQAAIPISMILSYHIKGERYNMHQYIGAIVVIIGIVTVLEPLVSGRHDPEYKCIAYNIETYCALCEEELTMEGCISHNTALHPPKNVSSSSSSSLGDDDEEDYNDYAWTSQLWTVVGTPAAYAYGDVMLRSLIGSSSGGGGGGDNNKHNEEICQWIPTDDPSSDYASSSSSSSSEMSSTTSLLFWSSMAIVACIPMCLSSIYKELTLNGVRNLGGGTGHDGEIRGGGGERGIDPIFLNGWVAVFQFAFSILLSLPAGMSSNPPITLTEWPANIIDGIKCYFGFGTITTGCHPDDHCDESPIYVNIFLLFNIGFNIVLAYILK
jgi:drug/metabolite transporter (DMT)-like permease